MATQSPLSVLNNTQAAVSTAENMGGIPVTETPTSAETTGAIVKAPTVKGGFSVPGNVALDPTQTSELLTNMQKMIDQRTGGWHDFMSGMQDTLALATPQRLGGPTQAMAQRASQKRQEQEDVFNMRAQMAALKAGASQAANQREVMQQILGGGGGAGAGGEGAAPNVFGGTQQIPAEIRQAMAMDPVNAPTILQKYLTTTAGETAKARLNPAWSAPTEVIDKNGQIIKVPLWQATELAMANPDNPKNRAVIKVAQEVQGPSPSMAGAAAGAPQLRGNAEGVAKDLNIPILSGYRSPEKQAELYAKRDVGGVPVAKPGYSQHQFGNAIDVDVKKLTPQQRTDLEANFTQPLPQKDPNHWVLKNAAPVAAPAAAGAGGPPTARPGESVASLQKRTELWQKQEEQNIGTAAKSGEESRKKAGDMIAAVEQNAKNADEVIRTADRVIGHATKHPKEFGYGYQQENPVLAAAANIPGVAPIVEKAVPAMMGAPGESSRRATTNTDASKLGLDFAAQMFSGTGARLGVGLEQMAANAKGVGTDLPAATNALNANLVKVAAEKAKEQAAAWRDWRASHGGDNADPYQFMQSAQNKAIVKKFDDKLDTFEEEAKKVYPEFFGEKTVKKNRKPLNAILGGGQ